MSNYKIVGIDLAKTVFQVAALNQANKVNMNKKASRKKLVKLMQQLPNSTVAMEACGSANYWARRFETMGHIEPPSPRQEGAYSATRYSHSYP